MIELRNVTKDYPMGELVYRALRGIALAIDRGEYVAISGASGSGKSTLLHVIGALHRPTSGEAWFDGENLATLSRERLAGVRNRKIGFVFQQFFLLPRSTALQNVEVPMVYAGVSRKEQETKAREALERVGLADFTHHRPTQLSGGQAQRVALARALVNVPQLILADEPTGNLDSQTSEEIVDLFDSLHHEGRTVAIVTHEAEIARRARREIVLRDGLIAEDRHGAV
ncbi:ABC transporter ATP-binding protein [Candidatus Bipolaricaulota bacterium]|nr:ABC transporter ATP-binding protein [Candidatus Bipolaricaulota bacterium]